MELDWKLIIAISALAISIYNLLDNRRMHKIEKKTIVLNELLEARLVIIQLNDIFSDINRIELFESIDSGSEILKLKNETEEQSKKLEYLFERIIDYDKCDKHLLESSRPLIHKAKLSAQIACSHAEKYRQDISVDTATK